MIKPGDETTHVTERLSWKRIYLLSWLPLQVKFQDVFLRLLYWHNQYDILGTFRRTHSFEQTNSKLIQHVCPKGPCQPLGTMWIPKSTSFPHPIRSNPNNQSQLKILPVLPESPCVPNVKCPHSPALPELQ